MRHAAHVIASTAIGALIAAHMHHTPPVVDQAPTAPPVNVNAYPPCAVEDGSYGPLPCMWDAQHSGNGQGRSYVIAADGTVTYV